MENPSAIIDHSTTRSGNIGYVYLSLVYKYRYDYVLNILTLLLFFTNT